MKSALVADVGTPVEVVDLLPAVPRAVEARPPTDERGLGLEAGCLVFAVPPPTRLSLSLSSNLRNMTLKGV